MELFGESPLSLALFALSIILFAVAVYFVFDYKRKTQKDIGELASRFEQIEKEYLKTKPQMEEISDSLNGLVDYPTMERKLRELISFVGERFKARK